MRLFQLIKKVSKTSGSNSKGKDLLMLNVNSQKFFGEYIAKISKNTFRFKQPSPKWLAHLNFKTFQILTIIKNFLCQRVRAMISGSDKSWL